MEQIRYTPCGISQGSRADSKLGVNPKSFGYIFPVSHR